jgi:hypothetical protein
MGRDRVGRKDIPYRQRKGREGINIKKIYIINGQGQDKTYTST